MMPIDWAVILIRAFGDQPPPREITQQQFDGNQDALHRLASENFANVRYGDWCDYCLDLKYVPLQPDLFRFVFPRLLLEWRRSLLERDHGVTGLVGEALDKPRFQGGWLLDEMAITDQRVTVWDFVTRSIIDLIDLESSLAHSGSGATPYDWCGAMSSAGCWVPRTGQMFEMLMSGDTTGRAIAWIQYVSSLIYREFENPVFEPWDRDRGGGPLSLGEIRNFHDAKWLPENVAALEKQLTLPNMERATRMSIARLGGHEHAAIAAGVLEGLLQVPDRVQNRAAFLVSWLNDPPPSTIFRWPDEA